LIVGIIASVWSLREFANEGATRKAVALAVFGLVAFALSLAALYVDRRWPEEEDDDDGRE
jgi:hypothetical protein